MIEFEAGGVTGVAIGVLNVLAVGEDCEERNAGAGAGGEFEFDEDGV